MITVFINNSECLTLDGLWSKISKEPKIEAEFKSKGQVKRLVLDRMLEMGSLKLGKAVDNPVAKNTGYEVNLTRAFANRLPYTIASLNPLPVVMRIDYITHLFFYHEFKAYEIYDKEHYPLLDKLNIDVQRYLDTDAMNFSPIFNSRELLRREFENIEDTDLVDIVKKKDTLMTDYFKKNASVFGRGYSHHTVDKSEEYFMYKLSQLKDKEYTSAI